MEIAKRQIKRTTLCFVVNRRDKKLLMILKKRGQGEGKWNAPGGKISPGETPLTAAIRETQEETGITPIDPSELGLLEFYFHESKSWDNICHVFIAEKYSGNLVPESEECTAHWMSLDKIPYDQMWDDDRLWVPFLLAGQKFHRIYTFDSNDRMISEEILD